MEPDGEVRFLDRDALVTSLDEQRMILAGKLRGLSREQAEAVAMPSGTTLLGLANHLAWVEIEWFQSVVAGRPIDLPAEVEPGVDASFSVADDASTESVLAFYDDACAASRLVLDEFGLDDVTKGAHWYFGHCSVAWVLHHMIRETARHAGHADILRELTDGTTGFL